jgi:hypothetical protein
MDRFNLARPIEAVSPLTPALVTTTDRPLDLNASPSLAGKASTLGIPYPAVRESPQYDDLYRRFFGTNVMADCPRQHNAKRGGNDCAAQTERGYCQSIDWRTKKQQGACHLDVSRRL